MKVIKQGALVEIKIGLQFIQRIQQLNFWFTETYNDRLKEFEDYLTAVSAGPTEAPEPWMYQFHTVLVILQDVEKKAEEQGFTEDLPDEQLGTGEQE